MKFISVLNYNISLLINNLFSEFYGSYHRVLLYPVESQTGDCIHNKINKTYECLCKPKYIIMISKVLNNKISKLIEKSKNKETIKITHINNFITFIVMLKFYPITAPLFLSLLFHKLKISLTDSEIERYDNAVMNFDIETQVVREVTEGVNEYRENFIKRETKLFQIIMRELSSTDSCNLRAVGENYFVEDDLILCNIVGICVIGGIGFTLLGAHLASKH